MSDDLLSNLKKRASVWANQISRKANAASKPKHIRVTSKVEETSGGKIVINSSAVSEKGDARAYEYGSGIHSTSKKKSKWQQGVNGKILITPKKAPVLAFNWQVLNKYAVGTRFPDSPKLIQIVGKGRGIFRYVEHPGVKPAGEGKGYLRPAITEVRKQIRKEVPKEVRDAYFGGIRKAFKK
jgi:hypothetical protein